MGSKEDLCVGCGTFAKPAAVYCVPCEDRLVRNEAKRNVALGEALEFLDQVEGVLLKGEAHDLLARCRFLKKKFQDITNIKE